MLRHTMLAALTATVLLAPRPALADGKIYVQLPDLSSYQGAEAEALLQDVVLANVVSSNCAGFEVTDEEWSLLVDSADILAYGQLKLSVDDYDAKYYMPAFADLEQAGTCAAEGPKVKPQLDMLVELGGSRKALPDQEQAYEDYRAMEASWAAATKPSKVK